MNLVESQFSTCDDEGVELPDLETARAYALAAARDILAEELRSGDPLDLQRHIEVTSDAGAVVLIVSFKEAIVLHS